MYVCVCTHVVSHGFEEEQIDDNECQYHILCAQK